MPSVKQEFRTILPLFLRFRLKEQELTTHLPIRVLPVSTSPASGFGDPFLRDNALANRVGRFPRQDFQCPAVRTVVGVSSPLETRQSAS
jgi:hypothetical protein